MARFGDGLALGPDLSKAAASAVEQALAPLSAAPDLVCVFGAGGLACWEGCCAGSEMLEAINNPRQRAVLTMFFSPILGTGRCGTDISLSVL